MLGGVTASGANVLHHHHGHKHKPKHPPHVVCTWKAGPHAHDRHHHGKFGHWECHVVTTTTTVKPTTTTKQAPDDHQATTTTVKPTTTTTTVAPTTTTLAPCPGFRLPDGSCIFNQ